MYSGYVGGFHDVKTFREETDLDPNDITDEEIKKLIGDDLTARRKQAEKGNSNLELKVEPGDKPKIPVDIKRQRELEMENARLRNAQNLNAKRVAELRKIIDWTDAERRQFELNKREREKLKHELGREKSKRRFYEAVLDPYHTADPLDAAVRHVEKERMRREIQEEMKAKKKASRSRKSSGRKTSRTRRKKTTTKKKKPKSRSRSRSRSKGKKSKKKSTRKPKKK